MIRRFPYRVGRHHCPECKRDLTGTTAGARACFYAADHKDETVLYELPPSERQRAKIALGQVA